MPDIDMDFDERRRGEMIRYVTEKYGEDRIAQIITYSTIKAKAAIKDSARVLYGQPGYAVADRISKAMPPAVMGKDIPLSGHLRPGAQALLGGHRGPRALRDRPRRSRRSSTPRAGLEGLKRQWGVHAAGVIMSAEPLIDVIPIQRREADGAIITQFDMGACETLGLLKMDFLGLRNLTIIDDALENIELNGKPAAATSRASSSTTRRPTSCSPAATRSGCSSSTAGRCATCCAGWRPPSSRTSPPSARCTGRARWAPTRTTTTPTARTAGRRSRRSTRSWPSRSRTSSARPTA